MILAYKKKADVAMWVMLSAISVVIAIFVLADLEDLNTEGSWSKFFRDVAFGIGTIAALLACWYYIKAKGRSEGWFLVLPLGFIGLIILGCLKDHAKDGIGPNPKSVATEAKVVKQYDQNTKKRLFRVGIISSVVWTIVLLVLAISFGDQGRRFDWTSFLTTFLLGGILPVVILWGVIWVRSAKEV